MSKYEYNKELKKYGNIHIPINEVTSKMMNHFSDIQYKKQKSNQKLCIKKADIVTRDNKNISALIYEPRNQESVTPCIIYFHGGGFMVKESLHHFKLAEKFAVETASKVVLLDYRLPPEYPYPYPVNDAVDTLKFILENAEKLKIDSNKIIVAGDSAGGNIAVELALQSKSKILALMLLYPVITNAMDTESMLMYRDTPIWDSKLNDKMWKWYLKDVKRYVPVTNRDNLNELPNLYVETAEFDCLRDEGRDFVKQVRKLGIPVTLNETEGTMHGYDAAYDTNFVKTIVKSRIDWINSLLI